MKTRLLHPSFFTDEKVRQLSPNAKVLLLGLWLRADDYGRAIYLPKLIEGEVFPTEQVDVFALLGEVIQMGMIRTYEVQGQQYYQVPSWEKWQNPKYRAKSPIPEPPEEFPEFLEQNSPTVAESAEIPLPVSVSGLLEEKVLEGVPRSRWAKFRDQLSTGEP